MSLTNLIAKDTEVKQRFKSEFTKPKFTVKKEILAPPVTNNPTLVGIAFDYLLRFYIQCLNPKKTIARDWVGSIAAALDKETMSKFNEIRVEAHEQHQIYLIGSEKNPNFPTGSYGPDHR